MTEPRRRFRPAARLAARLALAAALAAVGAAATRADHAPPPPVEPIATPQLTIDTARTRVGLARVVLDVADVELLGDRIRGRYELRIPLAPMMNDRGTLEILLPASHVAADGADATESTLVALRRAIVDRLPLTGSGDSAEDGRRHGIRCSMTPEGLIDIVVDTGDRILSFRTSYNLTR